MANSVILDIQNVTKTFGSQFAVNNISFRMEEGEIFGLLGPSGSGKTILMRMICGLSKPTKGDVLIYGNSITKNYTEAIKYVGGYIESPQFYMYSSGYYNLKYFSQFNSKITKKKIINSCKILGIEQQLNKLVKDYTISQKHKLGIAQAILHEPKLLVFDEPFKNLDAKGIQEMRDLLKTLAEKYKMSILISSKMLGEMEKLCHTIAVMNSGQLLELKSLAELKNSDDASKKLKITVDYPNFAGKILITEFKLKVNVAGNSIIVYNVNEKDADKLVSKLKFYKISVFKVESISKSLEQIFLEILERKAINKNWVT